MLCSIWLCITHNNIDVVLTLLNSLFPFAQCTGLEAGEPSRVVTGFGIVDACFESKDTLDVVYDLVETPLERSRDVSKRSLLALVFMIAFSRVPCIIAMFPLFVHYALLPVSIILMHPLIILWFFTLMLIWAMRITLSILGENVDNFMSLCYFSRYNAPLTRNACN